MAYIHIISMCPKKLCRYLRSLPKGWLFRIMQGKPAWHRFWRKDLGRSRFLLTCTNVGFHPHQCTAHGTHCSIKTHRPSHVPSCNTLTVATPSSIITVLKKKKKKKVWLSVLHHCTCSFPLTPCYRVLYFQHVICVTTSIHFQLEIPRNQLLLHYLEAEIHRSQQGTKRPDS